MVSGNMTEKSISSHHPIVIIGGGLTGKMMALALSYSGFRVTMMAPKPNGAPHSDKRSTTIHHAGAQMLSALGLMDMLAPHKTPIERICVAVGPEETQRSDWLLNWSSSDMPMAYVIENSHLDAAFDTALAQLPSAQSVTIIDDHLISYDETSSAGIIGTKKGQIIHASVIIACDGAGSKMRSLIGLTPKIENTHQSALIANLSCELPHDNTAFQRFLPTGPIAFMPLPDKDISMVWSTSDKQAEIVKNLSHQDASLAITKAFGLELGALRLHHNITSFALKPQRNRRLSKGRVLLAGDAAHAIHPLAGMGYNLALSDAAVLLDILHDLQKTGLPCDHISLAQRYARQRQVEIKSLTFVTSALNKILSRPSGPLSQIMAMGMSVMDKLPVKTALRDVAMGGTLSTASLLKGVSPTNPSS